MKINKFNFLKVLAKHLITKTSGPSSAFQVDLNLMATSLAPMFNTYAYKLKASNIMDEDNRIYIEGLQEKAEEFFSMVPAINFPFNSSTLTITKKDVDEFIKELYLYADVEEVIYLPCQN